MSGALKTRFDVNYLVRYLPDSKVGWQMKIWMIGV